MKIAIFASKSNGNRRMNDQYVGSLVLAVTRGGLGRGLGPSMFGLGRIFLATSWKKSAWAGSHKNNVSFFPDV